MSSLTSGRNTEQIYDELQNSLVADMQKKSTLSSNRKMTRAKASASEYIEPAKVETPLKVEDDVVESPVKAGRKPKPMELMDLSVKRRQKYQRN